MSQASVQIRALRRRDGDSCWLCGKKVGLRLPKDDPMRASRDHVIPRSLGGPDDLGNMKLAHRVCNSRRGAGGLGAPSPLLAAAWESWSASR
jgi:5-methylcytosine-specific restriction endonuclease McrA